MKLSEQYKLVKAKMYNKIKSNYYCFICNAIESLDVEDNGNNFPLLKDFRSKVDEARKFSEKHEVPFRDLLNIHDAWWTCEEYEIRLLFLDHIIQDLESQGL